MTNNSPSDLNVVITSDAIAHNRKIEQLLDQGTIGKPILAEGNVSHSFRIRNHSLKTHNNE